MLCGATTIGPEIAIAIISLIFYAVNCKKCGTKHEQNSRIVPFVPPFKVGVSSNDERGTHFNSDSLQQVSLDNTWRAHSVEEQSPTDGKRLDEMVVIEHMENMHNESVSTLLLKNMTKLHSILDNVNSDYNDRCFNGYDIPIMQLNSVKQVLTNSSDNEDDAGPKREKALQRNLASFNWIKDPTIGDGDCAFRAIVSQIPKPIEWSDPSSLLRERLAYLGLGKRTDTDVLKLRQLFVDNVQSNDYYQMFTGIPSLYLNDETERFREPGTLRGDVGDLVIKVCSDLLQVSMIVVTSIIGSPYVPFIPDDVVITKPIYLAYQAFGPGHYDGTVRAAETNTSKFHKQER